MKPDKTNHRKFSLTGRLRSFRYAFSGIRHAFIHEHNFRIHLIAALLVCSVGFYLHISKIDWIIILFAIGFVLVTELLNSAIEVMADFISPEKNNSIRILKDISAGAVLISVLTAIIAGALVFFPYLKTMFK
ncbi:diacylglycerol kinase family protein [soil metagenome]